MKVLILGAAGAMAIATIKDLLEFSDASKIVLTDIDNDRLQQRCRRFPDPRLEPKVLDLTRVDEVAAAMRGMDVVINEASYQLNIHAVQAAMQAGVPLLDLGGLYVMTRKQLALHQEVEKSGILVIPGMGSDPGTSNVLCRHGANKLDSVEDIHIRFGASWSGMTFYFAIETIIDEVMKDAVVFEDGEYKKIPALSRSEDTFFSEPVGTQKTYCILHSELGSIPEFIPGVKNVTYYDAWDPETIKRIRALIDLGLLKDDKVTLWDTETTIRQATIKLLAASTKEQQLNPGYDDLKVTVKGKADGCETRYDFEVMTAGKLDEGITPTAYATGTPPSIVAQMIVRGEIKGKGVLPPEACVDPEKYLRELRRREFIFLETKSQTQRW